MKLARVALVIWMLVALDVRAVAQTMAAPPPAIEHAPAAGLPPAPPPPPALPRAASSTPPRLVLAEPLVTRARRLSGDLHVLGRRSSGRVTSGVIQIGVGAAFATLGAFVSNEIGRSLLMLVGAGTIAHGTFQLTLVEDAEALAKEYESMPVLTPQQLAERVQVGELSLRKIARGARRARIADGSVAMSVAAVYVPLLWWLERRDDARYRFGDSAFDYVALALSGINFASGLVTALVSTEAERRLRDYEALRASLAAEPAPSTPGALSLRLGVLRAGASVSGQLRF